MEGGELTPALLSDRNAAPKITSIHVTLEETVAAMEAAVHSTRWASLNGVHAVVLVEHDLGLARVQRVTSSPAMSR